jgi:HlyD family secretion protein
MNGKVVTLLGLAISSCSRPDTMVTASGTIEQVQTDVAAVTPGRILRVLVDEGAAVRRGDTLALLSQSSLPADIEQRGARVVAAEAELRDLLEGARGPEIDRAAAELASAESEAERTARDAQRLARLAAAGGISQAQLDAAHSASQVAASRRDALRKALDLLREGARPERVRAARAAVATARAQLAMAEAAATDLVLLAPVDGVVLGRYAEPGEVLAAGVPAVSLGDPRRLWMRVYVAAATLAAIRMGDAVSFVVEGVPDRVFQARVASLATRAEFTPRVALTEQERADLLFGVRLEVLDTTATVKPGLPATARFDTSRAGADRGAPKP